METPERESGKGAAEGWLEHVVGLSGTCCSLLTITALQHPSVPGDLGMALCGVYGVRRS